MKKSRVLKLLIFIAAVAIVFFIGLKIAKGALFESTNTYYAYFPHSGGLKAGTQITVNGVKVLKRSFVDKNVDELKEIVDRGKEKMQSGIIILGTNNNGKAIFVVGVTKDLISKVKAGEIVKVAAQVAGGNGGGRPDFAQAGGKDGSAVKEAVEKAFEFVTEKL